VGAGGAGRTTTREIRFDSTNLIVQTAVSMKISGTSLPKAGNLERIREHLPDVHKDRHPFKRPDIPTLIRLLSDPASCNRGDALVALAKLGARSAVPAMIRRLRDPAWVVRCDAAEALGSVGDPRAVPALRRALESRNQHVRSYVAVALADLGDMGSRVRLEQMYRGHNVWDRISATSALYRLTRTPKYLDELGTFVREAPRYEMRYAAFHNLKWVMRPGDRSRVKRWLRSALRAEKDSPGLRKDIRGALASL
jgi:hypothetical protein